MTSDCLFAMVISYLPDEIAGQWISLHPTFSQNGQIEDLFEKRNEYFKLGESRTAASQGPLTPKQPKNKLSEELSFSFWVCALSCTVWPCLKTDKGLVTFKTGRCLWQKRELLSPQGRRNQLMWLQDRYNVVLDLWASIQTTQASYNLSYTYFYIAGKRGFFRSLSPALWRWNLPKPKIRILTDVA